MSKDSISEKESPLTITPNRLDFLPPLNRVITNILKLQNWGKKSVAYKVKTTAPKRYCVRPNTGVVTPGESVEVQVILNGKDQPTDLNSSDKFQVQMLVINQESGTSESQLRDLWAAAKEDEIIKQRLKCYFGKPGSISGSSSSSSSHPQAPSFLPTIQQSSEIDSEGDQTKLITRGRANSEADLHDASDNTVVVRVSEVVDNNSNNSSVLRELEKLRTEYKTVSEQLKSTSVERDDFQHQIQRLKQQLNQEKEELRQRRTPANNNSNNKMASPSSSPSQELVQQQQHILLIAILIAIVSFILGILFNKQIS